MHCIIVNSYKRFSPRKTIRKKINYATFEEIVDNFTQRKLWNDDQITSLT